MTPKHTALTLLRNAIPELQELHYCCKFSTIKPDDYCDACLLNMHELPVQLHHWLRALQLTVNVPEGSYLILDYDINDDSDVVVKFTLANGHPMINKIVNFDLTTGQPATEEDYTTIAHLLQASE